MLSLNLKSEVEMLSRVSTVLLNLMGKLKYLLFSLHYLITLYFSVQQFSPHCRLHCWWCKWIQRSRFQVCSNCSRCCCQDHCSCPSCCQGCTSCLRRTSRVCCPSCLQSCASRICCPISSCLIPSCLIPSCLSILCLPILSLCLQILKSLWSF